MDFYETGTEDNAEAFARQRTAMMGLVRTGVSETRAMVQETRLLMDDTNARVAKSRNPSLREQWAEVYARWSSFYKTTQGFPGAFNQFRDSTAERANIFGRQADKARAALRKEGQSAPPSKNAAARDKIDLPTISLPTKDMNGGFPWKWVLIGTGAVAVGYGVYTWLKPARTAVAVLAPSTEDKEAA
jgi:hypothetical protein